MVRDLVERRRRSLAPPLSVSPSAGVPGGSRARTAQGAADLATQLVLMVGAALLYFAVRGVTEGSEATAVRNAEALLRFEGALWLDVEAAAQELVLSDHSLVTLANWVYIWGHWPVIAGTLFWLYRHERSRYLLLTRAMFVSGAIGLVIFATYPVAPPRLMPDGVWVDTVTELSTSYRVLQPPALVNKYAALPSLHVGWNLLVGIVVFSVARRAVVRTAAVVLPVLMTCAVVLTGNHYVVDAVLGAMVALTGLAAARRLRSVSLEPRRWWPDRTSGDEPELGQQVGIVQDQPGDTDVDRAVGGGAVRHRPAEQDGGPTAQAPGNSPGEQAGVDAEPVHVPPEGQPEEGQQLGPVAC